MHNLKKIFSILMIGCFALSYTPTSFAAEGSQNVNFSVDTLDSVTVTVNGESIAVDDGDRISADPGTTFAIAGVEGYYLAAAYGKTASAAENSDDFVVSENKGDGISIKTDPSNTGANCCIYVTAETKNPENVSFSLKNLTSARVIVNGEAQDVSNGSNLIIPVGTKVTVKGVSGKYLTVRYSSAYDSSESMSSTAGENVTITTAKSNTSGESLITITASDTNPAADDPSIPDVPDDPVDPSDPVPSEDDWEDWNDTPSDPTSAADWAQYESNPPAPNGANYGKLTGVSHKYGSSYFTVEMLNGDIAGQRLKGLCTWDGVPAAKPNKTQGWVCEVVGDPNDPKIALNQAEYNPNYEKMIKSMYYGCYLGDAKSSKTKWTKLHLANCVWANQATTKAEKKKFAKNVNAANEAVTYITNKYCKKAMPPAELNFKVYRWYPSASIGSEDKYAAKRQVALVCGTSPSWGYVSIQKAASATNTNFLSEAPNNYSLVGATYQLYDSAGNPAIDAYGQSVPALQIQKFNDGTNIVYRTAPVAVKPGTYYAVETAASKGFKLDPNSGQGNAVEVTVSNTEYSPALIHSQDPPTWGQMISLAKTSSSGMYGYKRLIGAEYTLSYYDVAPSTTNVTGKTPTRSWVFKTVEKTDEKGHKYAGIDFATDDKISGDDFYIENTKGTSGEPSGRIMPCGIFTIEETKAPTGLAKDTTVYYGKVYQASNGAKATTVSPTGDSMIIEIGTPNDVEHDEGDQNVSIIIDKRNARTGENAATESETHHSDTRKGRFSTLAGAKYNVYYDDNTIGMPELVGVITTDENGYGELTKRELGDERFIGDKLLPGNYVIEEVGTAPGFVIDKYELNDGVQELVEDHAITVICGYDEDGEPIIQKIKGNYEEGKHVFIAKAQTLNTNLFSFTVKSEDEPTITHIKKTDATTTKELPGATLQIISLNEEDRGTLVEEWVSTTEEHLVYELPAGKYLLREITAPYGYDIAEDIEFEVEEGKIVTNVEMQNKPVTIETDAKDVETDTHQGVFSETAKIKDSVKLTGLYEGRTYKVTGVLKDKATGKSIVDGEGKEIEGQMIDADGKLIADNEFVATADTMEVNLLFSVDTSKFTKDTTVVAFEKLYRTTQVHDVEADVVPVELQKHEKIDDEKQSIHYGGIIRTIATEKESGEHNIFAGKGVLVDTVVYKNLSPQETYTLTAELFDKTTGQLTGITATAQFTPKEADGSTTVEFQFDGTKLANHTLVAFETLSLNTRVIDEHKNPEDEDQTVYVPEIRTEIGKKDGSKVIDVVTYKNLIPGKMYVVRGHFVSKKTGKKIRKSDGYTKFIPETPNGEVEVLLDPRKGSGKLVAVESCYIITGNDKETLVGRHADINDKAQTYSAPSKPKTGDTTVIFLFGGLFVLSAGAYFVYKKKRTH